MADARAFADMAPRARTGTRGFSIIDEVLLVYRCLWETNPSQAGDPGHGLRILVSLDAHGKVTGIEPSWVSPGQMPPEDIGGLSRLGQ